MSTVSSISSSTSAHSDIQWQAVIDSVASVLLGKEQQIKLALCCLLARGHLLIEDLPGMGKTTLSHALGEVLGLSYQRVQFTSDMLPADIVGASIYDKETGQFKFIKGPVFTQLLLADEINRSTPKTQSAFLEAMEEGQVSVDGITHQLPSPFFVIATQNPVSQSGTYPLPESQLDRFLMRIQLGYPDPEAEKQMLLRAQVRGSSIAENKLEAIVSAEELVVAQAEIDNIKASTVLIEYLQRLVNFTRSSSDFAFGISPRGSLAILQAAKAWAYLAKRDHVIPEDIQSILSSVVSHRLPLSNGVISNSDALITQMLNEVNAV